MSVFLPIPGNGGLLSGLISPHAEKLCKKNGHITFHHFFHPDVPGAIFRDDLFHDLTHTAVPVGFEIQIMLFFPSMV